MYIPGNGPNPAKNKNLTPASYMGCQQVRGDTMDKSQDGEGWKARMKALGASLALSYAQGYWEKLSRGQSAASLGPSQL